MDREKLTEARSKFIRDNKFLVGNNAPLIADAFEACAEAIMKMPISERLTEEEKETIIADYNEDVADDEYNDGYKSALRNIFGKDLFNDNPELLK